MRRETLRQSSTFGLIKQDIGHYLVIAAYDGMFERNYQLDEKLLDLLRGTVESLANELAAAANGFVQSMSAPAAQPTRVGDPLPGSRPDNLMPMR